ncbi:MAG: 4Fe-4S dicluster domain-containing protein [Gemmatimonadaceae bacterium]|nr:4Fe-4S dicluster domain-containing protein [Gemmatimonadaceae bacterium]
MSSSKEPNGATTSDGTRRQFLKILGATTATTAAIGCSSDRVERLIPYLNHPDETVPGVSTYYATTCRECVVACGLIAETRDGRTIKLEGNPAHPLNRGALCARGQAALQGLYNPDRYRGPMLRRNNRLEPVTWDQALQALAQKLGEVRSAGRAGDAVFINGSETGSFPAFLDQWLTGFGMPAHLSYDALADISAVAANRQSYGVSWPALRFSEAKLIVSVGADFLDGWGATVPQQLDFADARAKIEGAPRLVYIGSRRSLTGLNADEWIPCKPGSELAIVNALNGAAGASLDQAAQAAGVPAATLERLARDWTSTRPSLMLAGVTTANAMAVALAVNALNQAAGNVGVTIRPSEAISAFDNLSSPAEIAEALGRMNEGRVPLLFVRNANPIFTLPRSGKFAEALAKVAFKVSFSSYPDETSELCDLVLPDHHPLESWGDAQATATVMSLQQPTMDPVFSTRATADVLITLAKGNPTTAAQYPAPNYRTWLIGQFPGGPLAYAKALETAVVNAPAPAVRPMRELATIAIPAPLDRQPGDFFLTVYPSAVLGDRGANKPWLQELPDPVSKICWQSWVEIHPTTAARLDVDPGELVTLESPTGLKLTAPAYVYPGIRQDTVAMMFGQGHRSSRAGAEAINHRGYPEGTVLEGYGRYAVGVGVNPLDLLPPGFESESGALAWTSIKVKVSREGGYQQLVTTEGSARQHGRGIGRALVLTPTGLRDADAPEHEETPPVTAGDPPATHGAEAAAESGAHHFPGDASHEFLPGLRAPVANDAEGALANMEANDKGMYDPAHSSGMTNRRWAMTIDLARCTGCSACVTACYAENNIPTVGAAYQTKRAAVSATPGGNIHRGREMAWLRLERYYEGGENGSYEFDTRFVPMLCQHCGNAPCEPVCPVYATYHSPDGLNVQVYNRCVGTRYCSNNCPYKVRYFNWFGYGEPNRPQYAWPEPLNWQLNPDVNVRGKGVMEKCTFCVQRIREAENRASLEHRAVQADEFTVACAQACPSRAITFGDAASPEWAVSKQVNDRRAYHVFEELNTFTAVVYLKKVNHPGQGQPSIAPAAEGAHGG